MILRNRLYERKEPDRDATLCIVYREGSKREPQYFQYFKGLSTRIILEVVEADSQGDNSPSGCIGEPVLILKDSERNHLPSMR